jgi:hypothetical protein
MPGLVRGMARTAAVVGTAQATRGRVSRRQQKRWAGQDQAEYAQPQYAPQAPPPPPAAPPPVAAAPAPAAVDPIEQLERLAALKAQGVLTDEEFAAQKAKILGS